MIDLVITCDNKDGELGVYFEACAKKLIDILTDSQTISLNDKIDKKNCNRYYIEAKLESLQKFVFVAYSHGNPDALISLGESYVDEENASFFKDSLFYTPACSCGKYLSEVLIKQGCLAFIGYEEEVVVSRKHEDECNRLDNYAIIAFLCNTDKNYTIYEAYNAMLAAYDKKINELKRNEPMNAVAFIENRDALIFKGNKNLKLSDLV